MFLNYCFCIVIIYIYIYVCVCVCVYVRLLQRVNEVGLYTYTICVL